VDGDRVALVCALVAAAACRGAEAQRGDEPPTGPEPGHGVDVPTGWTEQPAIAEAAVAAAKQALAPDAAVHAHAWAEPARGCYLAIVEAHGTRREDLLKVIEQLQAGLGDIELADWTTSPDAEDQAEINARFTTTVGDAPSVAMAGRIRVHLARDRQRFPHAVAAACFYNDRQPAACDDACAPLLSMLEPLPLPEGP